MKFLFIIQGEGRGHMSQAIALHEILKEAGHKVGEVYLGRSRQRQVPAFFKDEFKGKINYFRSPNFRITKDRKGIQNGVSILHNLLLSPRYIREIWRLAKVIRRSEADVVVNFYDLIGGLANYFSHSEKKFFVISHHLYFSHPSFSWPEGYKLMKGFLLLHSEICSLKANVKLALSFSAENSLSGNKLQIVPPLLRKTLFDLKPEQKGHLLVYFLNEGYLKDLDQWSRQNPQQKISAFTGQPGLLENYNDSISVNALQGDIFLEQMATAEGVVCTAGFETVCEAFYLGKRILLVPSANHYEQLCNAHDAVSKGIAKTERKVNPGQLPVKPDERKLSEFRKWCDSAAEIYVKILCS